MRLDLEMRKAGCAHDAFKFPSAHSVERMTRFAFVERRAPATGQDGVNHSPGLPACTMKQRQTGGIDRIEIEPASGHEPLIKLVADLCRHRAAIPEHPKRKDEIKGARI